MDALVNALNHPHPGIACTLATFAGALLPQDFWPGDLEPVADGVRLLLAFGLNAVDGPRITRILNGSRAFAALPARLESVRRLPSRATEKCIAAARLRVELLRRHK